MQAAVLRLARPTASLRRAVVLRPFATATANPAHVAGATSAPASVTPKTANIPLNNIEQHWSKLSEDEQSTLYDELQELQKKDWKQLTLDEKKSFLLRSVWPSWAPDPHLETRGQLENSLLG